MKLYSGVIIVSLALAMMILVGCPEQKSAPVSIPIASNQSKTIDSLKAVLQSKDAEKDSIVASINKKFKVWVVLSFNTEQAIISDVQGVAKRSMNAAFIINLTKRNFLWMHDPSWKKKK